MNRRLTTLMLLTLLTIGPVSAQSSYGAIRNSIAQHFAQYQCSYMDLKNVRVSRSVISHDNKRIDIYLNQNFAYQLFRPETIDTIYNNLRSNLPQDVRRYTINIYSNDRRIEDMIPNYARKTKDSGLLWNGTVYNGEPWVKNLSKSFSIDKGLENTHLFVTPSHGYHFDSSKDGRWEWQRPPLYTTREDLLSQSFVYPYIIPMLENAGAIVYSSRERDWQTECIIVDNSSDKQSFRLTSPKRKSWQKRMGAGYNPDSAKICLTGNKPTVNTINTNSGKASNNAVAMWIPNIPADGDYAVYVTYQSYPNSVNNAKYLVFHSGGTTEFTVNQQIGGGTWVYLGTFHFKQGQSTQGMVTLDNSNSSNGMVCADAVRFGGGYSTTTRNKQPANIARYLEGAKYYAEFAGAPDSVFSKYNGADEYREDIWTRPYMANWLSGSSIFNTAQKGLGVPIELAFALHTDAGYYYGDTLTGSLGIHTTRHNDGVLGSGHTRDVSRDFADMILADLQNDITALTGRKWVERGIWDKDYCESREPAVPSMILELLSHQNFYDLKFALNPNFRFLASRSIYKSIAKWVNFMHSRPTVIQPLPVNSFMIQEERSNNTITLSWQPTTDPLEPTAMPTSYVVYTAIDDEGFDNGICINSNSYVISPKKGHIYRFKVTALNDGGESFPSETLSAYISESNKKYILIVNGFQRLSGPEAIETESEQGFNLARDPGVSYIASPVFCGEQQVFSKDNMDLEDSLAIGFSNDLYNGDVLAGNSFNYPFIHGKAIAESSNYSFVSCSREAVENGEISLSNYEIVDYILGLQKHTAQDTIYNKDYSTLSPAIQDALSSYLDGGGSLLLTGSYLGSDMCSTVQGEKFLEEKLHLNYSGSITDIEEDVVSGIKSNININRKPNREFYALPRPEILEPNGKAIAIMTYKKRKYSAGIGYNGKDYNCIVIGFPFESITNEKDRNKTMQAFIRYLSK